MKNAPVNYIDMPKRRELTLSPYLLALLCSYLVIVVLVAFYLTRAPQFHSDFSLVLPGTGTSSKVTLDEVGQVSQSSTSAFGNHAYSPISNYKQILLSPAVRVKAAETLGVDIKSIDKPKVKVLAQTSIINVLYAGDDAEFSKQKAWAIYEAFQMELNRLRMDEVARTDASGEKMLSVHKQRLSSTRKSIIDFQQRSLLVSLKQVDQLVGTLNKVQEDLMFSVSERQSQDQFVRRLSTHLGVSPALAGKALSLQSDAQFSGYLKELDTTAAQLSRFVSQWGDHHPKVVAEQQRFDVVLAKLADRSTTIVGFQNAKVLHGMNLNGSLQLSELFSELLDAAAKLNGLNAKIDELRLAEARIDDQLRVFAREAAELERLEREHQRAEAIYSAAAARLESSASDLFSSYPVVQLLAAPSLPMSTQSSRTTIATVVGLLAVLMVTLALVIVWQRDRLIKILLKRR